MGRSEDSEENAVDASGKTKQLVARINPDLSYRERQKLLDDVEALIETDSMAAEPLADRVKKHLKTEETRRAAFQILNRIAELEPDALQPMTDAIVRASARAEHEKTISTIEALFREIATRPDTQSQSGNPHLAEDIAGGILTRAKRQAVSDELVDTLLDISAKYGLQPVSCEIAREYRHIPAAQPGVAHYLDEHGEITTSDASELLEGILEAINQGDIHRGLETLQHLDGADHRLIRNQTEAIIEGCVESRTVGRRLGVVAAFRVFLPHLDLAMPVLRKAIAEGEETEQSAAIAVAKELLTDSRFEERVQDSHYSELRELARVVGEVIGDTPNTDALCRLGKYISTRVEPAQGEPIAEAMLDLLRTHPDDELPHVAIGKVLATTGKQRPNLAREIAALVDHPNQRVQATVTFALAEIGEAYPLLLHGAGEQFRQLVAEASDFEEQKHTPTIPSSLFEAGRESMLAGSPIPRHAIRALTNLASVECAPVVQTFPHIRAFARDSNAPYALRAEALKAARSIIIEYENESPSALELLFTIAESDESMPSRGDNSPEDRRHTLRTTAAEQLEAIAQREPAVLIDYVERLISILESDDIEYYRTERSLIGALGELGCQELSVARQILPTLRKHTQVFDQDEPEYYHSVSVAASVEIARFEAEYADLAPSDRQQVADIVDTMLRVTVADLQDRDLSLGRNIPELPPHWAEAIVAVAECREWDINEEYLRNAGTVLCRLVEAGEKRTVPFAVAVTWANRLEQIANQEPSVFTQLRPELFDLIENDTPTVASLGAGIILRLPTEDAMSESATTRLSEALGSEVYRSRFNTMRVVERLAADAPDSAMRFEPTLVHGMEDMNVGVRISSMQALVEMTTVDGFETPEKVLEAFDDRHPAVRHAAVQEIPGTELAFGEKLREVADTDDHEVVRAAAAERLNELETISVPGDSDEADGPPLQLDTSDFNGVFQAVAEGRIQADDIPIRLLERNYEELRGILTEYESGDSNPAVRLVLQLLDERTELVLNDDRILTFACTVDRAATPDRLALTAAIASRAPREFGRRDIEKLAEVFQDERERRITTDRVRHLTDACESIAAERPRDIPPKGVDELVKLAVGDGYDACLGDADVTRLSVQVDALNTLCLLVDSSRALRGTVSEAHEEFLECLSSTDSAVLQQAICRLFALTQPDMAIHQLRELTESPDSDVRLEARRALCEIEDPPEVGQEARELRASSSVEYLTTALSSGEPILRIEARNRIQQLASQKPPTIRIDLLDALCESSPTEDEDPLERQYQFEAISELVRELRPLSDGDLALDSGSVKELVRFAAEEVERATHPPLRVAALTTLTQLLYYDSETALSELRRRRSVLSQFGEYGTRPSYQEPMVELLGAIVVAGTRSDPQDEIGNLFAGIEVDDIETLFDSIPTSEQGPLISTVIRGSELPIPSDENPLTPTEFETYIIQAAERNPHSEVGMKAIQALGHLYPETENSNYFELIGEGLRQLSNARGPLDAAYSIANYENGIPEKWWDELLERVRMDEIKLSRVEKICSILFYVDEERAAQELRSILNEEDLSASTSTIIERQIEHYCS